MFCFAFCSLFKTDRLPFTEAYWRIIPMIRAKHMCLLTDCDRHKRLNLLFASQYINRLNKNPCGSVYLKWWNRFWKAPHKLAAFSYLHEFIQVEIVARTKAFIQIDYYLCCNANEGKKKTTINWTGFLLIKLIM